MNTNTDGLSSLRAARRGIKKYNTIIDYSMEPGAATEGKDGADEPGPRAGIDLAPTGSAALGVASRGAGRLAPIGAGRGWDGSISFNAITLGDVARRPFASRSNSPRGVSPSLFLAHKSIRRQRLSSLPFCFARINETIGTCKYSTAVCRMELPP